MFVQSALWPRVQSRFGRILVLNSEQLRALYRYIAKEASPAIAQRFTASGASPRNALVKLHCGGAFKAMGRRATADNGQVPASRKSGPKAAPLRLRRFHPVCRGSWP